MINQLLRRLALALSVAAALAGGQLAVVATPALASTNWPPIIVNGGICEDGTNEVPSRCSVLVQFPDPLREDLRIFLTAMPGSALPDRDYLQPEREPVPVPVGARETEVAVLIVQDGQCERPESFTLMLSTDDPTDVTVPVEIQIIDTACRTTR